MTNSRHSVGKLDVVLVQVMQRYHPNSLFDGGTPQSGPSGTVF